MNHEVEIVGRAAQDSVSFAGLDNQRIALLQLDRLVLDADARGAARREVDLGDKRMDVRLIHTFVCVAARGG